MFRKIMFLASNLYNFCEAMSRGPMQVVQKAPAQTRPTQEPSNSAARASSAAPEAPGSAPSLIRVLESMFAQMEASPTTSAEDRKLMPKILRFAREYSALLGRENSDLVVDTANGRRSLAEVLATKASVDEPAQEPPPPAT